MTFARGNFMIPDMVVVALMAMVAAYGVLSLVLRTDSVLMRVLGAVTSPARVPVAVLTPRLVPPAIVAIFTITLLYVIRIALFIASQSIR